MDLGHGKAGRRRVGDSRPRKKRRRSCLTMGTVISTCNNEKESKSCKAANQILRFFYSSEPLPAIGGADLSSSESLS